MPVELITSAYSNAGGRQNNEDCARFLETEGGGCWVLADGLGGHAGGEVASTVAVAAILDSFAANPDCSLDALKSHFTAAQVAIREKQEADPQLEDMRTTAVVLISDGSCALWGHVGDSRLYLFRKAALLLRTLDHSVPQALVASGQITERQIRFHEDRNRLLRTIGGKDEVRPAYALEPFQLAPGDAFLLASDGFWEYVFDAEMAIDLCKVTRPEPWLRLMNRRLRHAASNLHDNYSAMSIMAVENRS